MEARVRGVYGTPWSKLAKGLTVDRKTLEQLGACLIGIIVAEAKKDFAKRGWSLRDPMGGPPLPESFSHRIKGKKSLEITSTFFGMAELVSGGIPGRQMVWLSQEAKQRKPRRYRLTPTEKTLRRQKKIGRSDRIPLVIPIETAGGTVIFRTAPFKTNRAWVHPGIARFTFMQRAIRKGRVECAKILAAEVVKQLSEGDPTK